MVDDEEMAAAAAAAEAGGDYMNDADPSVLRFLIAAREEVDSTQLRDDLLSMLVAGHETTASALTWTMKLLAENPEKLAKVRPRGSLLCAVLGTFCAWALQGAAVPDRHGGRSASGFCARKSLKAFGLSLFSKKWRHCRLGPEETRDTASPRPAGFKSLVLGNPEALTLDP